MDFIRANQAQRINGVIQDPGLNMFIDENWNKRATDLEGRDQGDE